MPAAVRKIDINGAGVDRAVTDAGNVGRIIRWFDQLHVVPPGLGPSGCGPNMGTPVSFTFRAADGSRLANASVSSEPTNDCNPNTFDIGGSAQSPLKESGKVAFVTRVQRLLGVCFRDVVRKCTQNG